MMLRAAAAMRVAQPGGVRYASGPKLDLVVVVQAMDLALQALQAIPAEAGEAGEAGAVLRAREGTIRLRIQGVYTVILRAPKW